MLPYAREPSLPKIFGSDLWSHHNFGRRLGPRREAGEVSLSPRGSAQTTDDVLLVDFEIPRTMDVEIASGLAVSFISAPEKTGQSRDTFPRSHECPCVRPLSLFDRDEVIPL